MNNTEKLVEVLHSIMVDRREIESIRTDIDAINNDIGHINTSVSTNSEKIRNVESYADALCSDVERISDDYLLGSIKHTYDKGNNLTITAGTLKADANDDVEYNELEMDIFKETNDKIVHENEIQNKLGKGTREYRDSVSREIDLLKFKKQLLDILQNHK